MAQRKVTVDEEELKHMANRVHDSKTFLAEAALHSLRAFPLFHS